MSGVEEQQRIPSQMPIDDVDEPYHAIAGLNQCQYKEAMDQAEIPAANLTRGRHRHEHGPPHSIIVNNHFYEAHGHSHHTVVSYNSPQKANMKHRPLPTMTTTTTIRLDGGNSRGRAAAENDDRLLTREYRELFLLVMFFLFVGLAAAPCTLRQLIPNLPSYKIIPQHSIITNPVFTCYNLLNVIHIILILS